MMRNLLIIVFLIIQKVSFCQINSLDNDIQKLGWNSFTITTNYVSQLVLKPNAQKLIQLDVSSKIKKIFACLSNKKKVVIAHVILTQIFEPKANNFNQSYKYSHDKSKIISIKYTYNLLSWDWSTQIGNNISLENIDKIKEYWRKKIHI